MLKDIDYNDRASNYAENNPPNTRDVLYAMQKADKPSL